VTSSNWASPTPASPRLPRRSPPAALVEKRKRKQEVEPQMNADERR
jgi:hypothetical protein